MSQEVRSLIMVLLFIGVLAGGTYVILTFA